MNSKERMLTAIRHEEPDRVPVGEWQYGKEIIEPVVGGASLFLPDIRRIRGYWTGRRDAVISDWKHGLVALVRAMGWDAVLVHLVVGRNTPIDVPEEIGENKWRDSQGNILSYSAETDRMLMIGKDPGFAPAAASPGPAPDTTTAEPLASELEVVRHVVAELGKTHFIMSAPLGGHPRLRFSDASSGGVVDKWVAFYEDPDKYFEREMRRAGHPDTRIALEVSRREGIDGICYSCDYGMNTGPFMSPEMFRKYILPPLARYVELVHSYGLIFLHHACGNNQALMDMIVEAGVDVYQSIQPEMDIVEMKRRYGKNITLWGGVPSGDLIASTPERIEAAAQHYLEHCKPGGGYVFSTSHSIMPGAKYENYWAMLRAHGQHGRYA